jgi:hypothetical protein
MAETVKSLFMKARALLDEYSDDGSLIPDADVIDLQQKTIPLADMAQKELYKTGKLYKTLEFTMKPAQNMLGLLSNFNIVDFIGIPQYYPNESGIAGAKAYYFEADGEGIVTIEEKQGASWVAINTINIPATITSLTPFKGQIAPIASSNPIRLVFNGTTHYRHVNRALYAFPFAVGKIPDYRPWIRITMPSDFRSVDAIVEEYPERQYSRSINYKWEGFKDLYINYFFEGNIRVIYKPIPTTLTTINDVLEIDDITAQAIVYYVAARLAPFENKELVTYFESKFLELKIESQTETPMAAQTIIDVYGVGGGN